MAATSLPSMFISHGAPTLVMERGEASDFLRGLGDELENPRAVLCVSAHWETQRPTVTGAARPDIIYDFGGFARELYEQKYPAPGDPALAERIAALLGDFGFDAQIDPARGLDHGAWVPLKLMYPHADVPVLQLSLQSHLGPEHHFRLGRAIAPLREEGVLILASGGATHNLRDFRGQPADAPAMEYAIEFDRWLHECIILGDVPQLLDYVRRAPHAQRNHPTPEHLLPLFVAVGAARNPLGRELHRSFTFGMLSMAAYAWD